MLNRPEKTDTPPSLFSQPWWLDAVAPEHWCDVRIESGGKLVARLPYVVHEGRLGKHLTMPPLTQTLGPWIDDGEGKLCTRLGRQKELMEALIRGLPEFATFQQNFHYTIANWMPWYWAGFSQTTRYTYVLDDLSDLDCVFSGMSSGTKRNINKARKRVSVEDADSLDEFLALNELVFRRQSLSMPYTPEFVHRLDSACKSRGQRKILVARDASDRPHAAVYLVWDDDSAYFLMGGGHPELRESGAMSLCLWEAIRFAARVARRFDFEGSMLEPVERFFRGFGGSPRPFYSVSKSNLSMAARTVSRASSAMQLCWRRIVSRSSPPSQTPASGVAGPQSRNEN